MNSFVIYLVKASAISLILYFIYRFLFHRSTFYQLNRILLLFIVAFSIVCPVINLGGSLNELLINNNMELDSNLELAGSEELLYKAINEGRVVSISQVILVLYFIGAFIFLLRLFYQIKELRTIRREAVKVKNQAYSYYTTTSQLAPFSFMKWVFLSNESTNNDKLIIAHEKAHIRQLHSIDLIVYEVFSIVFWFNPVVYLLKQSLKSVHEYLADREVVNTTGDIEGYLKLMVNRVEVKFIAGVTNYFDGSIIKKRIDMITKKRTSKIKKLGYLVVLPVTISLILAFSNNVYDIGNDIPDSKPIRQSDIIRVSSEYGMRVHPITKELKMHNGIDIVAKKGVPVIATANGIVAKKEFKTEGKGHGRYVVLKHNEIYTTLYTQLSGFNVEINQRVNKGDIIGYVGESGISTGPHLHYEIRKNGENVNPADYFN